MSVRIALFVVIQLSASGFALLRGGAPERLMALMMVLATIGTAAIPHRDGQTFFVVQGARVAVDLALLAGVVVLATRANRFWPMWIASLQLLAIAVHGVRAYDSSLLPIVYARAIGEVAYPMILLLVIGTARHCARLEAVGADRSWSPLVWR